MFSVGKVDRAMLTCTIRLTDTRAKARALGVAVNVGVAALEELAGDEAAVPASRPAVNSTPVDGAPAAPAQRTAVTRVSPNCRIETSLATRNPDPGCTRSALADTPSWPIG
jgi:hypothetical protein